MDPTFKFQKVWMRDWMRPVVTQINECIQETAELGFYIGFKNTLSDLKADRLLLKAYGSSPILTVLASKIIQRDLPIVNCSWYEPGIQVTFSNSVAPNTTVYTLKNLLATIKSQRLL